MNGGSAVSLARPTRAVGVRILSALVLGPLALLMILQGGAVYLLMIGAVGWLVHREWRAVTDGGGFLWSLPGLVPGWAGAVALHLGEPETAWLLSGLGVIAAACAAVFRRRSAPWAAVGAAYVILPSLALVAVRLEGYEPVIWLFLVVWANDTGAYLTGSQIGGPKLWARVSPNKTWAGAIGGAIIGALAGMGLAALDGRTDLVACLVAALLIAVTAQVGDLVESAWKRFFKVKDSGSIIPGHGGVMDRIDGLIAAAVVLALMTRLDGVQI